MEMHVYPERLRVKGLRNCWFGLAQGVVFRKNGSDSCTLQGPRCVPGKDLAAPAFCAEKSPFVYCNSEGEIRCSRTKQKVV